MKLFIEFYHIRKYMISRDALIGTINSSFSFVDSEIYEYIKEDNLCTDPSPKMVLEEYLEKVGKHPECSEVYVSCLTVEQVVLTYLVAEKFPEKKFLVGGGGARYVCSIQKIGYALDVPLNVELTPYQLSKYFSLKKPVFRVPNFKNNIDSYLFVYSVDTTCPWLKCKFCYDTFKKFDKECYTNSMPDDPVPSFPEETVGKSRVIQFSASIVSKNTFSRLLPVFEGVPKDVKFMMFIRPDMNIDHIITSGLDVRRFVFWSGLEFPGDRVLSHINKGTTVEKYLQSTKKLKDAGATVVSSVILGWNFLTKEDVKEVEQNLKDERFNLIYLALCKVVHTPYLELGASIPEKNRHMLISSFETITDRWKDLLSSDFYEILSTEQEELNQEIRNLVTNTKFKGFQDGWDIAEAGKR